MADPTSKASQRQEGGNHYTKLKIQPMQYSMANGLDACQHTVVKYVTRFRDKGGIADLRKAIHTLELLIEHEQAGLDIPKLMTDLKSEGGTAQTIEDVKREVMAEKAQARDNIIQQVAAQSNALGWIEWLGGRQPVDNVMVEYRLRANHGETHARMAHQLSWAWQDSPNDIVEYRVIR